MSSFRFVTHNGSEGIREKDSHTLVNLDFDARVPIPFSVFPSSYRNDAAEETTRVRVERESNQRVGREGHESKYSSFSASLPARKDRTRYDEEEVKVYEEDRERRPRRKEDDVTVYAEEDRYRSDRHHRDHDRTGVEVTRDHHHHQHQHHHDQPEVEVRRDM